MLRFGPVSDPEGVLAGFRTRYPARPPAADRITHADQLVLLDASHGVRYLEPAPISGVLPGHPPSVDSSGRACHLWVFDAVGVPFVPEQVGAAAEFHDRVAKHTNITGGAPAHCGGEIWFAEPETDRIFVSGGSGRHGPKSSTELDDAVAVFTEFGFQTTSLGWDQETNSARRVLRIDD
jgi:hypothetical protein